MIKLCFYLSLLASSFAAEPIITKKYKTWLKANGVTFKDVAIGLSAKTGGSVSQRGLFASKDLKERDIFIRVLLQGAVINIEHAIADEKFMEYFTSESLDELDDPTVMAAFVAFCKATQHSLWYPYFNSLPIDFTTPLYFPNLNELQASEVADLTRLRLEQVAKSFDALPNELKTIVSPPLFQWAYTALLSRSFGLQVRDAEGQWQKAACLVPGADLLNTAAYTNADCGTNADSTHFECFTTAPVLKDEELLAPYGSFVNEQKLLLDYGFVLGTNFTARVILDPKWEPSNGHKPLPGSVVHSTEKSLAELKAAAKRGLQGVDEQTVCRFMIDRLQQHLSAYSTTIAEDEAILALPPSQSFDSRCRGCLHNVVRLRLGEKRVYHALLRDANAWLQELQIAPVNTEL